MMEKTYKIWVEDQKSIGEKTECDERESSGRRILLEAWI